MSATDIDTSIEPFVPKEQIQKVHLELTDKCNSACPMCARNINGGATMEGVGFSELYLEDVKKIFPPWLIKQLEIIDLCGNYGDPGIAQDTKEICAYIYEHNQKLKKYFHTNGSLRSKEWWKDLAQYFQVKSKVFFNIDGLGETNAIYRRKTNFDKIMENAKAFIDAGGRADWRCILFKHNQHQIDDIKKMASDMGFLDLKFIYTNRFYNKASFPVLDKNGEEEYQLEIAERYHDRSKLKPSTPGRNYSEKNEIFDNKDDDFMTIIKKASSGADNKISCYSKADKYLYVSAEGILFPCCTLGLNKGVNGRPTAVQKVFTSEDFETLNLKKIDWDTALRSPTLKAISDRWTQKVDENKVSTVNSCWLNCGKKSRSTLYTKA